MKEQSHSVHLLKEWGSQSVLSFQVLLSWLCVSAFFLTPKPERLPDSIDRDAESADAAYANQFLQKCFIVSLLVEITVFSVIILSVENPRTKMSILHWFPLLSPIFFFICAVYFNLCVAFHPRRLLANPGIFLLIGATAIVVVVSSKQQQLHINSHAFALSLACLTLGNAITAAQISIPIAGILHGVLPFLIEYLNRFLYDCNSPIEYSILAGIGCSNVAYYASNMFLFIYLEKQEQNSGTSIIDGDNSSFVQAEIPSSGKQTKLKKTTHGILQQFAFQLIFIGVFITLIFTLSHFNYGVTCQRIKPGVNVPKIPFPDNLPLVPCFEQFQNCTIVVVSENKTEDGNPPEGDPNSLIKSLRKKLNFEKHRKNQ